MKAGFAPRFRMTGVDTSNFMSMFTNRARLAANEFSREVAEELREYIVEVITKQKYKWAHLSQDYTDHKAAAGLDPRIYVATGFFLEHIEVWEDKAGIHVGFRPGIIHEPSGLDLNDLARILEYGTWSIPARPLWRPAYARTRQRSKELRRRLNISAARSLQEYLKRAKAVKKVDIRGE